MSKHETEIRALVVKMQDLITRYEFEELEELNESLENLCRRDLNEMMGCVVTVPGTVYAAWSEYMDRPKTIPNKLVGESEVYGSDSLYAVLPGSTEERFNGIMAQHYGLTKPQLGPDIVPITPNDELDSGRVKFAQGHSITRAQLIQKLEEWRLEAVELGLGLCALKLMEEREVVERLGEPNAIGFASQVVGACLMRMAEKRSQDILAGRYGTRAVIRNEQPTGRSKETRNIGEVEIPYTGRLKGVVQTSIPENEMPTDIHGKPADIIIDKLAIIPERPDFGIPLMGSYMDPTKPAPHNVRYETNQPAMDKIKAEKERTEIFVSIVPQEYAARMINDLQHLISITEDVDYGAVLCNEVRRLSLFANGNVKSLNDINFAWIYHK